MGKRKKRLMTDREAHERLLKTDENYRRLYERIQFHRRRLAERPSS
jgi:hypothetical protein